MQSGAKNIEVAVMEKGSGIRVCRSLPLVFFTMMTDFSPLFAKILEASEVEVFVSEIEKEKEAENQKKPTSTTGSS